MWTLIFILHLSSSYGASAVDHVDGFATESHCQVAGEKIKQSRSQTAYTPHSEVTYVCAYKGELKLK